MEQLQIETLETAPLPQIERHLTLCILQSLHTRSQQHQLIAIVRRPPQADHATIAQVLTWDMSVDVQPHKVITIAVTNGIVQVKLTGGRAALLSVGTFKSILE